MANDEQQKNIETICKTDIVLNATDDKRVHFGIFQVLCDMMHSNMR